MNAKLDENCVAGIRDHLLFSPSEDYSFRLLPVFGFVGLNHSAYCKAGSDGAGSSLCTIILISSEFPCRVLISLS